MAIGTSSDLAPINENEFFLAQSKHIKDSFPNFDTLAERNAIPLSVLKIGLIVYVVEDDKFYQWDGTVWNEKILGGTSNFRNVTGTSTILESDKGKLLSFENAIGSVVLNIPVDSISFTNCDYVIVKTKNGITNLIQVINPSVSLLNELGNSVSSYSTTESQLIVFRKFTTNIWSFTVISPSLVTNKLLFYVNPDDTVSNEVPVVLPKLLLESNFSTLEISSITYQSRPAGNSVWRSHSNLGELRTALNGDTAGTISKIRVIATFNPSWINESQVIIQAK